jgi:anti-sigma regulatory factor (Ser/Thr protein kinase)
MFAQPVLEECTLQLECGNRLLFGTDGFFDVLSSAKRPFQETVPEHWAALREAPIDWALSVICEEARNHGGGMIADDLLVIGFEQPPLTQTPHELTLRLPSHARAVDMACDKVSECIKEAHPGAAVKKEILFDVLLAVREALTNAMIHGNRNRPDSVIRLHCWRDEAQGSLTVTVADDGSGFDLASYVGPQDPLSERGRGIPLIRSYAQEVRMNGSELTMTFQLEEMAHDDR